MAALSMAEWKRYKDMLAKISQKAADEFRDAVFSASGRFRGVGLGNIPRDELIEYAYGLVTKYGEAAAALACEMYDASAALEGATVPPAIPAETATISEVAKAINGTMKTGNGDIVAGAVGRLTKTAGVDTTMKNAIRDDAEWAWIPSGDTCAFCITLASRGWQRASDKALKNGHAEHIHANCDCTYATRQTDDFIVRGYDPEKYRELYYDQPYAKPKDKINAMRREFYQMNKDEINEQKRSAYERRKAIEASTAEELNV